MEGTKHISVIAQKKNDIFLEFLELYINSELYLYFSVQIIRNKAFDY